MRTGINIYPLPLLLVYTVNYYYDAFLRKGVFMVEQVL